MELYFWKGDSILCGNYRNAVTVTVAITIERQIPTNDKVFWLGWTGHHKFSWSAVCRMSHVFGQHYPKEMVFANNVDARLDEKGCIIQSIYEKRFFEHAVAHLSTFDQTKTATKNIGICAIAGAHAGKRKHPQKNFPMFQISRWIKKSKQQTTILQLFFYFLFKMSS